MWQLVAAPMDHITTLKWGSGGRRLVAIGGNAHVEEDGGVSKIISFSWVVTSPMGASCQAGGQNLSLKSKM